MTKRNRTAPADFAKLRANKVMRTKNGLAEFDPTGTKMKVTAKNGKVFYYGIDPKTDKPVYMGTNYGVNAKTGKILPVNPDDEDE